MTDVRVFWAKHRATGPWVSAIHRAFMMGTDATGDLRIKLGEDR